MIAVSKKPISRFRVESAGRLVIPALCIASFAVYVGLRVGNFLLVEEVREFPDTPVYTGIASRSFFDPRFWVGPRPWTVPLVYKLLANAPERIFMFQSAFSILSWGVLAVFATRAMRVRLLGVVAFVAVLVFSLSAEVSMWDGVMVCDSISLSLMALFIASWLWLLEGWDFRKAGVVIGAAFLWAFAYDTNAWAVVMIGLLLVFMAAIGRARKSYFLIAAVLVMIFAASDFTANKARRWRVAFINTVGTRILPSPERTEYFAQSGMPITPALTRLTGKKAWAENWAFFKDPALAEFRDWLHARGKSSYVRFLLSHPAVTILEPLRHPEELLASELRNYAPIGFSPVLRGAFAEIVYPKKWALVWIWAAAIILGVAVGTRIWKHNTAFLVPLGMILLVYPHAVLIWHGDPNEIGRHALQAAVYFRLGLWLLVLFVGDWVIGRRSSGQSWSAAARTA
jgi:hypothetical protein